MLLSSKVKSYTKLKDQLALAENHKRFIVPVALPGKYELDPSMEYTLAKTPTFSFQDPELMMHLHYVIQLHGQADYLQEEVSWLEQKLGFLNTRIGEQLGIHHN